MTDQIDKTIERLAERVASGIAGDWALLSAERGYSHKRHVDSIAALVAVELAPIKRVLEAVQDYADRFPASASNLRKALADLQETKE